VANGIAKTPGNRAITAPLLNMLSLKWRWQADGALRSSPVVDAAGIVYLACTDGYVYALDTSGAEAEELWSSHIGAHGATNLALGAEHLYATTINGTVIAFRMGTGKRSWVQYVPIGER